MNKHLLPIRIAFNIIYLLFSLWYLQFIFQQFLLRSSHRFLKFVEDFIYFMNSESLI